MERSRQLRYAGGLVLIGLAVLLLLCVAGFNANDPPNADHPANVEISNACGIAGAYVAYGMRYVFGTASYLFAVFIGGIGVLLLSNKHIQDRVVRVVGIAILLISWCAFIQRVLPSGGAPAGHGGIIGFMINKYLFDAVGAGAYIIVLIGLAVGALLAADVWVFWMGRKSIELITMHGERKPSGEDEEDESEAVLRKAEPADPLAEQKELLRKRIEQQRAEAKKRRAKEKGAGRVAEAHPTEDAEAETLTIGTPRVRRSAAVEVAGKVEQTAPYRLPGMDLLDPIPPPDPRARGEQVEKKREVLERTLEEFGIAAQVVEIDRGPVITQFELELAPGVKITRVAALADDIARAMKAPSVRVVAPIPGKSTIGVEVPNAHREIVRLRELFESGVLDRRRMTIPLLLGRDATGEPLIADLAQSPHLLIAGATGSGKSVCINSLIMTLVMTQHPDHMKMLLVDPKMVELSVFGNIPHLMAPVLTDMKKAAAVLEWAAQKMDERYSLLANVGARNIAAYNTLGEKGIRKRLGVGPTDDIEGVPLHMPYIVIIIDELADLMMIAAKDVENSITRLAQKSRAVGIHLIVATQRPSVDVVTGLIKANLPSRMAFQMSSKVDSRTILDRNGAEKLLGQGDMLFLPPGTSSLVRAQGSFTSDEEIKRVTAFLGEMAHPRFATELVNPKGFDSTAPGERDELFDEAVRIILESQRGSVSLLQRKLGVGYSRAARLIDMMAEVGLVGDYKGSQAREVLYTLEQWEEAQQNESEN